MAREAASLRPQGDVSCAEAPHPSVPWRPERNDHVLVPVFRDLRWSSTTVLPCKNDNVLNDPLLVYDLLLRWRIQVHLSSHLSNFRHQWKQRNWRVWLQHKRSDPNSTAIVFQCTRWYFAAECFVHSAASLLFAWRLSFDCSDLHHSTGGANKHCSIHPPVPSTFLIQIVNPEDQDEGWMAAETSTMFAHRTVPEEGTARRPTFRSYAVLPSRPTANRRCMLAARHKPRQQIVGCWHLDTRSSLHCQFDRSDMSFDDIH